MFTGLTHIAALLTPRHLPIQLDPEIPHTLYDSLTHKRPAGFEVLGKRYEATDWRSVLIRTCELLAATDKALFQSLTRDKTMQGRKIPFFVDDPSGMRSPREIDGTGVHLMTNLSANRIRSIIERMLRKYRIEYITDNETKGMCRFKPKDDTVIGNVTIYLPRTFLTENGIEPEEVFETVIVGKEWDFHTTKTLPFLK